MKSKIVLAASIVILLISTAALYVSAQIVFGNGVRPSRESETMNLQTPGIVLVEKVIYENGKAEYVIPTTAISNPKVQNGTLRIEKLDGSIQELDLTTVKKVTIEK